MSRVPKLPDYDTKTVGSDAIRYVRAHAFIKQMRKLKENLTPQQIRTLRGQALAGDLEGAQKGLERILGYHATDGRVWH